MSIVNLPTWTIGRQAKSPDYRPEVDSLHINDPLVRRLFSERGPLYLKKRTIVPIRSIDPVTGEVSTYAPGDTMPVRGDPLLLAVHMGLFHTLGWSDEEPNTQFYLPFVYHSFLLAFAVDDARTYATLQNGSADESELLKKRAEELALHYMRANYWVCRIRCCDQAKDGTWKDCTPLEAYNRTREAVETLVSERERLVRTETTVSIGATKLHFPHYQPAVVVWPEPPSRPYSTGYFDAERLESSVHHHCSRETIRLAEAASRANSAIRQQLTKTTSVLKVPPAINANHSAQQRLLSTAMTGLSIGSVKQAGQSIQAGGDASGYAQEWERIMRDYDETAAGNERAQVICKELLVRGYTPITIAEQQRQ